MAAASNPWGVDENKYYQQIGGMQEYAQLIAEVMDAKNMSQAYKVSLPLHFHNLLGPVLGVL
jgi:hypothetical protein